MLTYATFCDFGNPDRINVITIHQSLDTTRRAYKQIRRQFSKGRVWAAAVKGQIETGADYRRGHPKFALIEAGHILNDGTTPTLLDSVR